LSSTRRRFGSVVSSPAGGMDPGCRSSLSPPRSRRGPSHAARRRSAHRRFAFDQGRPTTHRRVVSQQARPQDGPAFPLSRASRQARRLQDRRLVSRVRGSLERRSKDRRSSSDDRAVRAVMKSIAVASARDHVLAVEDGMCHGRLGAATKESELVVDAMPAQTEVRHSSCLAGH
jgi:hypothetical protein